MAAAQLSEIELAAGRKPLRLVNAADNRADTSVFCAAPAREMLPQNSLSAQRAIRALPQRRRGFLHCREIQVKFSILRQSRRPANRVGLGDGQSGPKSRSFNGMKVSKNQRRILSMVGSPAAAKRLSPSRTKLPAGNPPGLSIRCACGLRPAGSDKFAVRASDVRRTGLTAPQAENCRELSD
jgi:hypothetical protein